MPRDLPHPAALPRKPLRVDIPDHLPPPSSPDFIEVSFVMPCLNEAQTIAQCVRAAFHAIHTHNLRAEVIVADNGSTDGSQDLASAAGARVINIPRKGYGCALQGGFAAARGSFLIMGDSDLSYDFADSFKFIQKLRQGFDLVMGNRFDASGGGGILPGAMPIKNRYLGNPLLSWFGRLLFNCPARDFHCGLRALRRDILHSINVHTHGMEFASEMVIKATLAGLKITEVPIKLHPDGRNRPPHLRPWRDGWRHLKFMLCLSPRFTLFIPGLLLLAFGVAVSALVAFNPFVVAGVAFDVHTLIAASLATIVGCQWIAMGLLIRAFTLAHAIGPPAPLLDRLARHINLESGLIAAALLASLGLASIAYVILQWSNAGFGPLDVHSTLRPMVLGVTAIALAVQAAMTGALASMFAMHTQHAPAHTPAAHHSSTECPL